MVDKDELAALRAEVRRRHRAATSKVSRLRSRGVELGGSNFDVRRDLSKVKRYNAQQLKAYANQLNSFVTRSNAFVPGDSGVPIPAAKWREYKRLEKAFNERGQRHYTQIADTFLPNAGMTVRQRDDTLRPTRVKAAGEPVKRPYEAINRSSHNITGPESLDVLMRDMQRRTSRDYLPGELAKSREQFMNMLTEIGNQEHIEAARKLRDDQFDTLWNYTSFATDVSRDYEIMKLRARGEQERAHEKVHEDNTHEIGEILQWATFLPEKGSRARGRR